MKRITTIAVIGGTLLTATLISPVMAATHKSKEMTCEQFVVLDDVIKPKVVYWNSGFVNNKGKYVDPVVDIEETDKLIPILITECQKAPKTALRKKLKEIKGGKSK